MPDTIQATAPMSLAKQIERLAKESWSSVQAHDLHNIAAEVAGLEAEQQEWRNQQTAVLNYPQAWARVAKAEHIRAQEFEAQGKAEEAARARDRAAVYDRCADQLAEALGVVIERG